MDKELLKDKLIEHKPKLILLACLAVAFIAGYGAGTFETKGNQSHRQLNYTTKEGSPPTPTSIPKPTESVVKGSADSACKIKGSKSKLYHMPDGSFYDRTTPVQCFNTEAEAVAAGFTKSSR